MNRPKTIFVHHSASPVTTGPSTIRKWHLERSFSDIGYHKVVFMAGGIVIAADGRPENVVGAHTLHHNQDSLGVCVSGNYSEYLMKGIVCEELLEVVRGWMSKYGIPVERVLGHREVAPTECPGRLFDLNKFRAALTE